MINEKLDKNISYLDDIFFECGDIVKRKFPVYLFGKETFVYISYIDMIVDRRLIEENIINRLMLEIHDGNRPSVAANAFDAIKDCAITTADLKETQEMNDVIQGILSGDTALLIDGYKTAIVISTKGWPNRGVQSTDTEVVVQGSKEAFTEVFRFNTVLIRRRIRDSNLKVHQMKVGKRSETDVALLYLQDVVRPKILDEAIKRIKNINIDAILDTGYVEQLIEEDWLSPFPQCQVTERPDKAAAAILEGRIVIVVDNSPFVLIIPSTLNTFFQSSEDYYQRWQIMSFVRIIRYIAGFIAIALPGLYLAIAVYHPSMMPMLLIFKMAGARESVPFPAVIEIVIMELAFELLREAGIRLPGPIGSTIGIVGGLIIGQAAVEAGLVSPIVVIIVALTGISSFAIPSVSLVSGFRLMKYFIIFASAMLGLFGFWVASLLILIHLVSLKSFGIPYLFPFASGDVNGYSDFKDTILRFPSFSMKKRPIFANPDQVNRLKVPQTGNKKKTE